MVQPTIILAFGDYGRSRSHHLRGLNTELDAIREAMQAVPFCKLEIILDASIEKVLAAFEKATGPVVGFHFAGHGNGYELALKESISGAGFARFLGNQESLQWVFLNSCASARHARLLLNEGINAVITTSRAIKDEEALAFARHFYQRLAAFDHLQEAFNYYPSIQEMKISEEAPVYRDRHVIEDFGLDPLWELHIRPGAEQVKEWSLIKAAGNPLLGLPPIPPEYPLPEKPFRSLERFERAHADVFFGRGYEILELYKFASADALQSPVQLLYGQSGVGKSSLLEAGLLPRLEKDYVIKYIRKEARLNLPAMLLESLGADQSSDLLIHWKSLEKEHQKPIILIFDQLEEVYVHDALEGQKELEAFLKWLSGIFYRPTERPQGKVILSFRKEFLSEIQSLVRKLELPYQLLPILPLGREGIIQAIVGISQQERLGQKYGLQIEEGLAEKIADQLLDDTQSSIAPVLQILLSRMWKEATKDNPAKPFFSLETFQQVRKSGYLLDNFVQEKFGEIRTWHAESEESGLLLDILHFHVTDLNTAGKQSLQSLRKRYAHRADILDGLIQEIRRSYLLIDSKTDQSTPALRLVHDTLGPILNKEYELSQRNGQVATRILESKAFEMQQNGGRSFLSEHSLELVEKGRGGMRQWESEEKRLIEESKAMIRQQKRLKNGLRWGGLLAGIILILTLSSSLYFSQLNNQSQQARLLYAEAQNALQESPPKSLALLKESYHIRADSQTLKSYYQIQQDYVQHIEWIKCLQPVRAMNLSSDHRYLAVAFGRTVWVEEIQPDISTINRAKIDMPLLVNGLFFTDPDYLLIMDEKGNFKHWKIQSQSTTSSWKNESGFIYRLSIDTPEVRFQYRHEEEIYSWNWETKVLSKSSDSKEKISWDWQEELLSRFFHVGPNFTALPSTNGQLSLHSEKSLFSVLKNDLIGHTSSPSHAYLLPIGKQKLLVTAAMGDSSIRLWDLNQLPVIEKHFPTEVKRMWAFGDQWLIQRNNDLEVWDWNFEQRIQKNESAQYRKVTDLLFDSQQAFCIVALTDSLFAWDIAHDQILWKKELREEISYMALKNGKLNYVLEGDSLIQIVDMSSGEAQSDGVEVLISDADLGGSRLSTMPALNLSITLNQSLQQIELRDPQGFIYRSIPFEGKLRQRHVIIEKDRLAIFQPNGLLRVYIIPPLPNLHDPQD